MPGKLIINADDFGLTSGVNRAIRELAEAGALSSATLMANSAKFSEAVAIAHKLPSLGVGCHVVLTDGSPVCTPMEIPTLIGSDGKNFRASLRDFWLAVLLGKVDSADVEREAAAQIEKLQRAGITVTHVDTHKHTHILPSIARAVLSTAKRLGVQAMRNPFEQSWSLRLTHSSLKRALQVRLMTALRSKFQALPQIRSGCVVTTEGTIGISATGHLNADGLDSLLRHVPDGIWELVCHPGYHDDELGAITTRLREAREVERLALMEAFVESSSHPFSGALIHYGMLDQERKLKTQNKNNTNASVETGGNVMSA